ncbi:sigma 54-interacting transcriptional regulator [Polyangium sp. 6x1]|uniref:sigma 54-interacting transcriptional regulator n=1 Tax=Polyangium sp. 6x1 TaxID=3042689 RepID=UPI002482C078|nr:sigma 54-interacting transcriptional regulator [Polyangium sp. 6x1]MDI1449464.1 sigma 54-interacting transcriptional regulator [Polyangium sp. 6x1]
MADAGPRTSPLDRSSPQEPSGVRTEGVFGGETGTLPSGAVIAAPSVRASLRGLAAVDDLLCAKGASGLVVLHGPRATLEAVGAHAARRAQVIGRACLRVAEVAWDEPWREIAAQMGIVDVVEPRLVAARIASAANGAMIVVSEGTPTHWGQAVVEELARLVVTPPRAGSAPLVLVLREVASAPAGARLVQIDPIASPEDLRRFWEAIAQAAELRLGAEEGRLEALERWWSAARRAPLDGRAEPLVLEPAQRRLCARLALAQRSLPAAEAGRLGASTDVEALVARGAATIDAAGSMKLTGAAPIELEADREDAVAVASALEALFPMDPWAMLRAAELRARAGDAERAELLATRALSGVAEPSARVDFWRRWEAALALFPDASTTKALLRSAELALRVGDAERATGFARAAAARDGNAPEVMITLGKALSAEGDLTTATIVLERAMSRADASGARARAAVELAEVRYTGGDLEAARRFAEEALEGTSDLATRLGARNVLGKLLLAAASWSEAEAHFAADAWEAACGGEGIAELRARLNRAIAVLSTGRLDEARPMLASVLDDGTARGEHRAVGFALTNLATIAILKRDYPEAFHLSERAIEVFRRIRERLFLATVIPNLAELRLDLGLVAEAEQTLAFGRQACGPAIPGTRAPHFALVAARIHLARGRTLEARAELASAIAGASGSSNGAKLCECHSLAARIALDDGNVTRAAQAIERARAHASSTLARAEVALLEATRARAAGEPWDGAAEEALDLAREADAPELEREARVLLCHAEITRGDAREAEAHLQAALASRDRMASSLPEGIRERFLARPELRGLAALEARAPRSSEPGLRPCERCGEASCPGCSSPSLPASPLSLRVPSSSPSRSSVTAIERIVGRDATMLALLSAIKKVAKADTTVLIQGESGSGKELVADAIHEMSPRRAGPLVKVNCSALVETLLLSELFGHEKGAFTGAQARRRGRFELAEGGTIFLDEIGDISQRTQVALLRVLEDKSFERVGGAQPIRANVRILCATHRDLRAMVARGEFREDLYYRLRQVVLEVPALRQRIADMPLITSALLARIAQERGEPQKTLSERAIEALMRHAWHGNVRELENALRAASLFAEGDVIELEDFTTNVEYMRGVAAEITRGASSPSSSEQQDARGGSGGASQLAERRSQGEGDSTPVEVTYAHVRSGVSLSDMKRKIERECIARALEESGGNITRAAVLLGMKRPRLSQLVKQYGLGSASEDGS